MCKAIGAVLTILVFVGWAALPAAANGTPSMPGVYIMSKDGTYRWVPPLSRGLPGERPNADATRARPASGGPAMFGIGEVLTAPTFELPDIDHIAINSEDEKLRFVFTIAFADEYATGSSQALGISGDEAISGGSGVAGDVRSSLVMTKWGYSARNFDVLPSVDGLRRYYSRSDDAYFANYTRPLLGDGRIIDVGRAIATNRGIYLFNTSGSLSNLLWDIHSNERSLYIPELKSLLARLEARANRFNEWGTIAWTYKDFGDTEKAVAIYRDKVLPHTRNFDAAQRDIWQRYFDEISR